MIELQTEFRISDNLQRPVEILTNTFCAVSRLFLVLLFSSYICFQGWKCIGQWNVGERGRESSCDVWWRTCQCRYARWKHWPVSRSWWKEIVSLCLLYEVMLFWYLAFSIRYVYAMIINYPANFSSKAYSIFVTRMIVNGHCLLSNQSNDGIPPCEFFE